MPDTVNPRRKRALLAIACFALVAATLVWRRPGAFARPQLWAEDGSIFLTQAILDGPRSLLTRYAGYFHTYPRLAALGALALPLRFAPHVFLLAAWTSMALVVGMLFSSRLQLTLPARFAMGLALAAVPVSNEVFGNGANAHWFLALAMLLVAISDAPRTRGEGVFDVGVTLAAASTSPLVIVWWPLLAWRWFRRRDRWSLAVFVLSAAAAVVQARGLFGRAQDGGATQGAGMVRLVAAKFLGVFMGETTKPDDVAGAVVVAALCALAALTAWIAVRAWRARDAGRLTVLAASGLAALAALAIVRTAPDLAMDFPLSGRYAFVPTVTIVWALLAAANRPSVFDHALVAASFAAFAFLTPSTKLDRWPELEWPGDAERALAEGRTTKVPIHPVCDPPMWFVRIHRRSFDVPPPAHPCGATFGDMIELVAWDATDFDGGVTLTLAWRAATLMAHDNAFTVASGATVVDAAPLSGDYPTSFWAKGEVVVDRVRIDASSSREFAIAWHDASGRPLATRGADGVGAPGGVIVLRR